MSETRRELLASGLAALPGLSTSTPSATPQPAATPSFSADCVKPGGGPNATYFPNVVLETQHRRRVLFYDDLLVGRIVLLHFLSASQEAENPMLRTLSQVQPWLGDHLGRDIFLYSLSADPQNDTPEVLARVAERYDAHPGWLFLTGQAEDLEGLRGRLFAHNGPHHGAAAARDCSVGLARYGNESIGLWGSVPTNSNPQWIARRLSWMMPREAPSGPPRRGGPHPLPQAVRERYNTNETQSTPQKGGR